MSVRINSWYEGAGAVILAAGQGTRARPLTNNLPKALLPINGKPLICHNIEYWTRYIDKSKFTIVTSREGLLPIKAYTQHLLTSPVYSVQEEPKGIANALLCAKDSLPERFVIILADCMVEGEFDIPEELNFGVGVCEKGDVTKNYSVYSRCGFAKVLIEKPIEDSSGWCGMGYYWMSMKIFDYINKENDGITEVVQRMINDGCEVAPIPLQSRYSNIGTIEDLESW